MVTGVVGPARILLDDDSLRIPRAAAYFGIHIILSIATARQSPFTILKYPASDIAGEGLALMLLNGLQEVSDFLREGLFGSMQWIKRWRGIVKSWPWGLNGWNRGSG